MEKSKVCKGNGIANGHGCGKKNIRRMYGLGMNCCFYDWLHNTPEGEKVRNKFKITNKPKVEVKNVNPKLRPKKSIAILIGEAREPFQKLIRIRDLGKNCICCNKPLPNNIIEYDGGHFKKAELYSGLIFNPDNVHGQLRDCNNDSNKNDTDFAALLIKRIGQDRFDNLIEISHSYRSFKWDRLQLIDLKNHYNKELQYVLQGKIDIKDVNFKIGIIN